jgi:Family of unknown function (DUF6338)
MAFNYAICSPLLYLLVFSPNFFGHLRLKALVWFVVGFIVPIILAMINAIIVQKDGLGWLFQVLGLSTTRPIPTGWHGIFSTAAPCHVLIRLKDGTEIAGYFGARSMASSEPERKDIYIERVYQVPEDGRPWREVDHSRGMYIDGSQIASIEFRDVSGQEV